MAGLYDHDVESLFLDWNLCLLQANITFLSRLRFEYMLNLSVNEHSTAALPNLFNHNSFVLLIEP